jgi:Na+/H+ antiporter NhaD/arsenite permease-like protein
MHTLLGERLPLWSVIPFAGLLLSIAFMPLLLSHFWHRHYAKVAAAWGLMFLVPFLAQFRAEAGRAILTVALHEYLPFIVLLWSLFTVTGGIVVRGTMSGTPRSNLVLLAVGAFIASWIGTTGASMLLVHPLLRGLERRRHRAHTVVFFIFMVSNMGGLLTPLGDPPLFLGFLNGVPFFWTLRLWPQFFVLNGMLLLVFFGLDSRFYRREEDARSAPAPREPLRLDGLVNLPLLLGILACVLASGSVHLSSVRLFGLELEAQDLLRDAALIALGLASLRLTPRALRAANQFSFGPMREVAYLFAGIFATMIPALAILLAGDRGPLAAMTRTVDAPVEYFWITGAFSSILDTAPTYLTFLSAALGKFYPGIEVHEAVHHLIEEHGQVLVAISCGAVFMGANTYIGNAPNFMVRSIAEERGVAMPSFLGYIFRWSLPILVPSFVLLTLLFLRSP